MSQPTSTSTYLGLTIGPIYRTMASLRRTRALFAGSYLFSYLMRRLLFHLTADKIDGKPNPNTLAGDFLIPYMPADKNKAERETYLSGQKGVGLFPDRLLIKAASGDFDRLKRVRSVVLEELVNKLNAGKGPRKVSLDFIERYINVYCLAAELPTGAETINELNRLINNLELRETFINQKNLDLNELFNYLSENELDRTAGPLMEDAFDENRAFKSLPEIAVQGLRATNPDEFKLQEKEWKQWWKNQDDNALMQTMQQKFKPHFRQYHKYIAIVQADGDNLGVRIGASNADPKALGELSKKLYDFGQQANQVIGAYGGSPVYIGGDDLLFFAPVATLTPTGQLDETIFDCLTKLDEKFSAAFPFEDGQQPTLSYGVSISYYKYPLNEARDEAYALMKRAKDKIRYPKKNAVEFKILKNAGTYFAAGFSKSDPYFERAKKLIATNISGSEWLNSAIYFVQYFDKLLPELSRKEIENLFRNRLDEDIHKRNSDFLYTTLPEFIHEVYESFHQSSTSQSARPHEQETPESRKEQPQTGQIGSGRETAEEHADAANKAAQALIHSTLRFIQFIRTNRAEADH